jgi:Tfp pilus assembly protein PilF
LVFFRVGKLYICYIFVTADRIPRSGTYRVSHTQRTQEAIAELKMALADDKDGHIHYQMARFFLKIGDCDSAKQAFQV